MEKSKNALWKCCIFSDSLFLRWLNIVETVGRQYAFIKFGLRCACCTSLGICWSYLVTSLCRPCDPEAEEGLLWSQLHLQHEETERRPAQYPEHHAQINWWHFGQRKQTGRYKIYFKSKQSNVYLYMQRWAKFLKIWLMNRSDTSGGQSNCLWR